MHFNDPKVVKSTVITSVVTELKFTGVAVGTLVTVLYAPVPSRKVEALPPVVKVTPLTLVVVIVAPEIVGEVPNTNAPEPVSSVTAEAS